MLSDGDILLHGGTVGATEAAVGCVQGLIIERATDVLQWVLLCRVAAGSARVVLLLVQMCYRGCFSSNTSDVTVLQGVQ